MTPKAALKAALFASRWLQAPFYAGLVLLLMALGVKFFQELVRIVPQLLDMKAKRLVLACLALTDLVLVANLLFMVVIWGFGKFVSRMDLGEGDDGLGWVTRLGGSALRIEIAASLIAISSLHLLEAFLDVDEIADDKLLWLVVIQLTFAATAVMMAWLDRLTPHATDSGSADGRPGE